MSWADPAPDEVIERLRSQIARLEERWSRALHALCVAPKVPRWPRTPYSRFMWDLPACPGSCPLTRAYGANHRRRMTRSISGVTSRGDLEWSAIILVANSRLNVGSQANPVKTCEMKLPAPVARA